MTATFSHHVQTYTAKIYIAGPIEVAKQVLRKWAFDHGACFTIDPTTYIYTGGEEAGYVVGLINYPRFPKNPNLLFQEAMTIAQLLLEETHQHSFTVVADDRTEWFSRRAQ